MNNTRHKSHLEDIEADIRMLGLSNAEFILQLAQTNKELLRDTLHEAGHCVAAWIKGFPVHEMNIDELAAWRRGFKLTTFEIAGWKLKCSPARTNFNVAVVALAGLAAEGMIFKGSHKKSAWKSDIDDAKEHLKQIPEENDQDAAYKRALDAAKELVKENWSIIARVTIGAYHYGPVLDGARIMDLIAGAIEMDEDASIPSNPQR